MASSNNDENTVLHMYIDLSKQVLVVIQGLKLWYQ